MYSQYKGLRTSNILSTSLELFLHLHLLLQNIPLDVQNRILLALQQDIHLIVNELELPSHLLINIIDLVHRSDCPMHVLKIGQIFVEGTLHFVMFFVGERRPLVPGNLFLQEVFFA